MMRIKEGQARLRLVVRPAGAMSDVMTIDAIRALRMGWVMDLLRAKHTVEAMVERGSVEVEGAELLSELRGEAARDMARDVCVELRAAGVEILVNGVPLISSLHLIHPPGDGDGADATRS